MLDFDDVLVKVGEFGTYQILLFLMIFPFAVFVTFVVFGQIFITLTPAHWCRIPALQNLTLHVRRNLSTPYMFKDDLVQFDPCRQYDVDYDAIVASGNLNPDPNWPITTCKNGWEYDLSETRYHSIVTENDWVCSRDMFAPIAQSVFFVGSIIGGIVYGRAADKYGRVPVLIVCNLVACLAGCLTAKATSYPEFLFYRFLIGTAFDNCFIMYYILVLEYVGPKYRTLVANLSIALFYTFGTIVLPWLAYFIRDWKIFCVVTSAPMALAVLSYWLVPESARWLISQGKIKEAIQIIRKFEKINKNKLPQEMIDRFEHTAKQMSQDTKGAPLPSVLSLFRFTRMRTITILLIVIWMIISLAYDGHARNVGNLGFNIFVTFTIASSTELPADILLVFILDRWGRRWPLCLFLALGGAVSLATVLFSMGDSIPIAVLAMIGRFCINVAFNIGLQYAAELLPTVVRAQGVAFIHVMGYVANIFSPLIVSLSSVHSVLPLIIFGMLTILASFLALFLPETINSELPNTLEDGEEFGKDQKFCDCPCTRRQTSKNIVTSKLDSEESLSSLTPLKPHLSMHRRKSSRRPLKPMEQLCQRPEIHRSSILIYIN